MSGNLRGWSLMLFVNLVVDYVVIIGLTHLVVRKYLRSRPGPVAVFAYADFLMVILIWYLSAILRDPKLELNLAIADIGSILSWIGCLWMAVGFARLIILSQQRQ
jgi:hypothetical protein